MNILFIFHHIILPSDGGVQRVTSLLSDELRKRGHKICYLAVNASDEKPGLPQDNPYHQYFLDHSGSEGESKFLKGYQQILEKEQINVVINQQPIAAALLLLRNTPAQIKRISCFHLQPFAYIGWERRVKKTLHPTTLKSKVFRFASILFPEIYRRQIIERGRRAFYEMSEVSDKIVVLSERFIPRIIRYAPKIDRSKLAWINNPNTFTITEEIQDRKEKVLLYVGRFEPPQKNMFGFIDFWRDFTKLQPDWKAYILGDGEERPLLENYAKRLGLKNLNFMGHCKNVNDYYQKASFVCLTSHSEGWGMVLTEGMAYGCVPVCFGSYEAAYDIIIDGEDGIIATPFDTCEMAARVDSLIKSPEKMIGTSEKARHKISSFNIKKTVDRWEQLLNSI